MKPDDAVAAAKQADAVIMVLGLSPRLKGEEMSVAVEGFVGNPTVLVLRMEARWPTYSSATTIRQAVCRSRSLSPSIDCRRSPATAPFFRSEPRFPFGCGLSCTSFASRDLTEPKEPDTHRAVRLKLAARQFANPATTAVAAGTLNLQGCRLPVN